MTYANNAERQKAYRERFRQRLEQRIETHEERLEQIQLAILKLEELMKEAGLTPIGVTEEHSEYGENRG